ncbi:MAG: hypothetical protein WC307_01970 [Candidatus Nanoarchaeia archaeon]|jgi:hypothetical protein
MKLLQRKHYWQGRESALTLETEEKVVLIRISEDNTDKAVFKLSADEARALRDSLKTALSKCDEEERRQLNETIEQPSQMFFNEPAPTTNNSFRLFNNEEETPKKDESRLYY